MSGVSIVRFLLAANTALVAQVPSVRIMAGVLPVGTTLPAISITTISAVERKTVTMADSHQVTERVQVNVEAKSYPSQKSILALVRAALPLSRGTVNSVSVDSVTHDSDGPDIYDMDAGIYVQSSDFFVRYAR